MFMVRERARIATKLVLCFCLVLIFIFGMLSFYERARWDEPVFLVEGRQLNTREMSWIISSEEAADYIIGIYEDQKMAGVEVTRDNYLMGAVRQALVTKKENELAIEAYASWIKQSHDVFGNDLISQKLWQRAFPEEHFPVIDMFDRRFLFVGCIFLIMLLLCGFGIFLFFPRRIRKFERYFSRVLPRGRRDIIRFPGKNTWLERNLGSLVDFPENTTRKLKEFRQSF
jgi:hypothetical protein